MRYRPRCRQTVARRKPCWVTTIADNEVIVSFDEPQARVAAGAFQRYGKAQGHPAQLNMGDCAVYALAKTANEPLLFVGNDFSQTDIEPC